MHNGHATGLTVVAGSPDSMPLKGGGGRSAPSNSRPMAALRNIPQLASRLIAYRPPISHRPSQGFLPKHARPDRGRNRHARPSVWSRIARCPRKYQHQLLIFGVNQHQLPARSLCYRRRTLTADSHLEQRTPLGWRVHERLVGCDKAVDTRQIVFAYTDMENLVRSCVLGCPVHEGLAFLLRQE